MNYFDTCIYDKNKYNIVEANGFENMKPYIKNTIINSLLLCVKGADDKNFLNYVKGEKYV